MLYESPMQSIVDCLNRVRCDFCKARDLKHPTTGKYMQKGTQTFSSSMIMSRSLELSKCPRNHEHSQVAVSFQKGDGSRCVVSEYIELYTKTFGKHLAKAMRASRMTAESALKCPLLMFHSHHYEETKSDAAAQDVKRRRLNAKTSNPAGYPPNVAVSESSPSDPSVKC